MKRGAAPRALAIVGPTATGKTTLAVEVALRLNGEVISVDSRQAYRGLQVGTAAPTEDDMRGVPHYGVGILDPEELYAAGRFACLARQWVGEIMARRQIPILCGGTGLFLDALLHPVFREPEMDEERRQRLRRWLERLPDSRLQCWVERLDPALKDRLAVVDRQRAGRTLELALLSGHPASWWQDHGEASAPPLRALCYVLTLPAEAHRERIALRAAHLLKQGWAREVQRLLEEGHEGSPAWNAVGYREMRAWVQGEMDRKTALEEIVRATWRYARRQRTWYRNRLPQAIRLDAREPAAQLAARIAGDWQAGETAPGHATGKVMMGDS